MPGAPEKGERIELKREFTIRDRRLTYRGLEPLTAGSAGADTFTIDFDAEWTGLTKLVVLRNGGNTAQLVYSGETAIPANVLVPGELYIACHGYRKLEDTVAVVHTVTMVRPVVIVESLPAPDGDPAVYTPTLFEQIVAETGAAREAAAAADAVRLELQAGLENGSFVGPPGPPGENATITVDGAEAGENAAVYNLGTARNARLRFVLPRARGLQSLTYSAAENRWTVTYSDGTQAEFPGPVVPGTVSGSVSSTSDETAASSGAVKQAYDLAAAAMPKAGGTFTGAAAAASQTPGSYLLRNSKLAGAEEPPTVNGEICWVYG